MKTALDLVFPTGILTTSSMAQLSPQKRKKRKLQLRDAQRRRRARLKQESKSFLQIILTETSLNALRSYSEIVGKPLHTCAAELIEKGLISLQRLNPPYPSISDTLNRS